MDKKTDKKADKEAVQKTKNKKVLIGIVAAAILLLGLVFGGITLAGNTPARRAEKYLNLGNKYLNELDYEQALVAYRQVLEIEPKNLDAYKGALQASEGLGDRDSMVELYIAALGVIEGLTEEELKLVYDTAVEIYLYADNVYLENHEAAAQALERGYDTLGGDERLIRELIKEYGILAGMYIDAGDYEKEQEIYRKILEKGLENAEGLSGWEQRVRDRFQEYLRKNGGNGNTPGTPAEPTPDPTPAPTPEPTPKPTPEPIVLQGNVKDSGEYKGLSWQVTDAGELAVTGHMEGEGIDSEDVWLEAPWRQYKEEIAFAYMNFTGAKSLSCLFGSYNSTSPVLSEVYFNGLDTSSVTSMGSMFYGCSSLSIVDLSSLNTSRVTDMSSMFEGCGSLSSVDLSGFDTSSVTDMSWMFYGCSSLNSVDLSGFDMSSVTSMGYMFYGCSSLSSVDLSGFDTSSVTDMGGMFWGCNSLSSVDLSGLDTSSVTSMGTMFYGCSSLSSVDLSGFDTSSVTDMSWMFYGCSSLNSLDLSSFDVGSMTNIEVMFWGCRNLQEILVGDHWQRQSSDLIYFGAFENCGVSDVTHK